MKHYPHLFSPVKIGPLTLKNRICVSPMTITGRGEEKGYFAQDNIDFYTTLARGGAALLTIGETGVHSRTDACHPRMAHLDDPGLLPSLTRLVDSVHQYDTFVSIELVHSGRRAHPAYLPEDGEVWGPSPSVNHYGAEVKEMTEDMMNEIADAYAEAAFMAKFAGVDMVMVHGGHGWLLDQFLSPLNNKRTDKYGGSLENRARFPIMVLDRVRERCGRNFPIEYRISGSELIEGGLEEEEMAVFAHMIEDKVDSFHVSVGSFHDPATMVRMFPGPFFPNGVNIPYAAVIKKAVSVPVTGIGGLSDPEYMEKLLEEGQVDMVAMGRQMIADPFLPKKAMKGKSCEIAHCIRCMRCNSGALIPYVPYPNGVVYCSVNPVMGRLREIARENSFENENKKILIAGGGPAGMQAALGGLERGHSVVLCESSDSLGKTLSYSEHIEFKYDIRMFRDSLISRVQNSQAEIRMNTAVTPELIRELEPDLVISAVGGEPFIPPIEGIDHGNVIFAASMHKLGAVPGNNTVIIGGGLMGCEEAIALAQDGKNVTIVEMTDVIAGEADGGLKQMIDEKIALYRIPVLTGHSCVRITDEGAAVKNKDGEETMLKADTVLIAAGVRPKDMETNRLRETCYDLGIEFIAVGDCRKTGRIREATSSGYFAGRNA